MFILKLIVAFNDGVHIYSYFKNYQSQNYFAKYDNGYLPEKIKFINCAEFLYTSNEKIITI